MNEKDRRLVEFCAVNDCKGVLLHRRSNIAWVSDGADVGVAGSQEIGEASVVWTPKRKIVMTNNIETNRLALEEFDDEWDIVDHPWWESADVLSDEDEYICDVPVDRVAELRSSLTSDEIDRVSELGNDTAEVVQRVLFHIRSGMTEYEVAGDIRRFLQKRGIEAPVLLVGSDERIDRFRHPIPTKKHIERVVMVAVCARRHGLFVALTRLVYFGTLPDDLRDRHDAVCQVDAALRSATEPGVMWCDILEEGLRAYKDVGFEDEWKLHHQGGPMGYEARDFLVTPTERRLVEDHQLVGWNPSITGTKSEDTILSSTREVLTVMDNWPMTPHGRPDILRRA